MVSVWHPAYWIQSFKSWRWNTSPRKKQEWNHRNVAPEKKMIPDPWIQKNEQQRSRAHDEEKKSLRGCIVNWYTSSSASSSSSSRWLGMLVEAIITWVARRITQTKRSSPPGSYRRRTMLIRRRLTADYWDCLTVRTTRAVRLTKKRIAFYLSSSSSWSDGPKKASSNGPNINTWPSQNVLFMPINNFNAQGLT